MNSSHFQSITFQHNGRKFRLVKRAVDRSAPWYPEFVCKGKRPRISLETSEKDVAIQRCKERIIDPIYQGKWKPSSETAKPTASALADCAEIYRKFWAQQPRTARNNISAVIGMVMRVQEAKCQVLSAKLLECDEALANMLGRTRALQCRSISLDVLTPELVDEYQAAVRREYETAARSSCEGQRKAGAAVDVDVELRTARLRADRTTLSTFRQAKSVFSEQRGWLRRYRAAGLAVPACVTDWARTSGAGKQHRASYLPPDDALIRATFSAAVELGNTDPEVALLFWLSIGTAMRRREVVNGRWRDLISVDGRLCVQAGMSKANKPFIVPVMDKLLAGYTAQSPAVFLRMAATGKVLDEFFFAGSAGTRYNDLPKKLNWWLHQHGWKDEKKMHALRAFVGSKIYEQSPRLAQLYLRHESLVTTEKFYSHYAEVKTSGVVL